MNPFKRFLILFSTSCVFASPDVEVRVVRNNTEVPLPQSSALEDHLVQLLESCSMNSTGTTEAEELWDSTLSSGSFIQLKFREPRSIDLMTKLNHKREEYAVDEILLPLPEGRWPTHILVRCGKETWAFSKYTLSTLQGVISEPALRLGSVRPYNWLIGLKPDK